MKNCFLIGQLTLVEKKYEKQRKDIGISGATFEQLFEKFGASFLKKLENFRDNQAPLVSILFPLVSTLIFSFVVSSIECRFKVIMSKRLHSVKLKRLRRIYVTT